MSYFYQPPNPDEYHNGFSENDTPRNSRLKLNVGIFLVVFGLLATSVAANISLGGTNRQKEFGQGIYQIKACDQWVGIGLTSGQGAQNTYVANVRLIGLDPRLCKGTIFRIKFFATGSTTALPMYLGAGTTTAATDSVTATTLVTRITNTAYTGGTSAAYEAWAYDAVTLIDPQGRDIQFGDRYEIIDYAPATAVYTVIFTLPKAVATQVARITIETAKY
ncbi:unannotated protein [freshwater metagenome]|uniref:Unannotated protein n=1 Tax=freshwater metagenome TaxID=449393 RepID=A0A6J7ESX5_9ZZZZ|nr:hypothetical protein [Actinomycetota bacterium]